MQGKVVFIDDNPLDLRMVTLAVERMGFSCHPFENHGDAIEWLEKNSVQAIFLDLQMPDVSGFDLITRFKKRPETRDVPIIIVSGQNSLEDVKRAVGLGATDFVIKPLDPLILQEKMARVKQKSGSNSFAAVVSVEERFQNCFFAKPMKLVKLSEFGVIAESESRVEVGETIELRGLDRDYFSSDTIIARCLSAEPVGGSGTSTMQFTFVGMSEVQRQAIRKLCRRLWIESKQDNGQEAV